MTYHTWYARCGSVGVDTFAPSVKSRFSLSQGRCREWELRLPLTRKWTLELSTKGKDYLTLVNGPKYLRNLNWILDEFDSSFNNLAIASLRYHLDYSVCNNSDVRVKYEDLIARLSEDSPGLTPEQSEAALSITFPMTSSSLTQEQHAALDAVRENESMWQERIDKARHDFVDIMRGLWS